MISCDALPRVSMVWKPNSVAIVSRLSESGSIAGTQRHRIGFTEMYVVVFLHACVGMRMRMHVCVCVCVCVYMTKETCTHLYLLTHVLRQP
jgi:hypothetical protein